jgi:hypothetical protein
MIYRPVREKSPEVLDRQARILSETTGYEEISLSSLSISDYTQLEPLCDKLLNCLINDWLFKLAFPNNDYIPAHLFQLHIVIRISANVTGDFGFPKFFVVLGHTKYLQPSCACQKQPFTKITVLYLGRTMSGFPGSRTSFFL